MPYEILLFVLILGLAALLIYLTDMRRTNIENYVDYTDNPDDAKFISSYTLYMGNNSQEFDNQMKSLKVALNDKENLLHVYGCGIALGKSPTALHDYVSKIAKGLYTYTLNDDAMYANNIESVTKLIEQKIDEFYQTIAQGKPIQGQIYVLLSQAPYYRDDDGNPLSLQYTASQYGFQSTNVFRENTSSIHPNIKFHGYMIFTAYNSKGNLIQNKQIRKEKVMNIKRNCRQKQTLCFMKCPQSLNMPCGCASQDIDDVNNIPYLSTCLDSGKPTPMSEGYPYTYAILYRVNPMFGTFPVNNKIAKDYSDFNWSPSKINPIPTVNNPKPTVSIKTDVPKNNIVIYQHCNYKGFKTEPIPVGKYTMEHIQKYFGNDDTVNTDVSSLKLNGFIKVKMYKGTAELPIPIDVGTKDGYITESIRCFATYIGLNDNLVSIEIEKLSDEEKAKMKAKEKAEERAAQKAKDKAKDKARRKKQASNNNNNIIQNVQNIVKKIF